LLLAHDQISHISNTISILDVKEFKGIDLVLIQEGNNGRLQNIEVKQLGLRQRKRNNLVGQRSQHQRNINVIQEGTFRADQEFFQKLFAASVFLFVRI
jgi:NMD protein affecting ribosome stability and mRNA decay